MAVNDSNTNSALQSSVAFLQIQKNSNLKRATNMNEDVFRIFRRTGRRIALIEQQVERERCMYLKESYTEKNQLYKELSGIFNYKNALQNKQTGAEGPSGSPARKTLDTKNPNKDVRSINVNVLKRCECCRRRAFRKIENNDGEENFEVGFEDDPFSQTGESQDLEGKGNDKVKHRTTKKISKAAEGNHKIKEDNGKTGKTRTVQFSRFDHIRMPTNNRVPVSVLLTEKNNGVSLTPVQSKSVSVLAAKSSTSPQTEDKPARSASTAVGPSLASRALSLRLEAQNSNNEKLRLDGNAWVSHLRDVQEKKTNSAAVSGMSKVYCAFRKLVKKMKEEEELDHVEDEELRAESLAETYSESRPVSTMCRRDSRWLPLRRTSIARGTRLNTRTTGNLEPTFMPGNFQEENEEKNNLALI